MNKLLPIIGITVLTALTFASGMIHGRMSDRWGLPKSMLKEAEKLDKIPDTFGEWTFIEGSKEEFSETVANELECAGNTVRMYRNADTNAVVQVALFVGPPGPTSLHTPEVCYPARDNEIIEERQHVAIGEDEDSKDIFWGLTFESKGLQKKKIRVYYAWSPGDHWSAPESPRFSFASQPHLFKIQLSSNLPAMADLNEMDPCREFLEDFIPVLAKCLSDKSNEQANEPDESGPP